MCLAVKTSFLSSQSFGVTSASTRSVKPFIFEAPPSFISTVVKLMAEIIVASHKSTNRNKFVIDNLGIKFYILSLSQYSEYYCRHSFLVNYTSKRQRVLLFGRNSSFLLLLILDYEVHV